MLPTMKLALMTVVCLAVSGALGTAGCCTRATQAGTGPVKSEPVMAADTTIVLVRHAEKGPGQDPSLTDAGTHRAESLARSLAGAGVEAVYVSQFKRTQETAAPTAKAFGLTAVVMPIGQQAQASAAGIAADIRGHHAGGCVLVVGHSNTVPLVMKELGVANPPTIRESEFDRLFVVVMRQGGEVRMVEATYGP